MHVCFNHRYYSGDQDRLFSEAHIVSPNRTNSRPTPSKRVSIILLSWDMYNMYPLKAHGTLCPYNLTFTFFWSWENFWYYYGLWIHFQLNLASKLIINHYCYSLQVNTRSSSALPEGNCDICLSVTNISASTLLLLCTMFFVCSTYSVDFGQSYCEWC